MNDIVISKIDLLLKEYTSENPWIAIWVIHKWKFVYEKSIGKVDLSDEKQIDRDTNFRLASVTKHFVAVLVLQLISEKKLSFNDTLKTFFDFPGYAKNVSIYNLLTHTSWLLDYEDLIKNDRQLFDADVLSLLEKQHHIKFKPWTQYDYNNWGYCLLRLIIEKVSWENFNDYINKKIFLLTWMKNTTTNESKYIIKNRAYGHSFLNKKWEKTDQDCTSSTLGDWWIYSSLHDLLLRDQALYQNIVLPEAYKKMLFTPQKLYNWEYITTSSGDGYSFWLRIEKERNNYVIFHWWSSIWFRTWILRVPSRKVSIIVLSNRDDIEWSVLCKKIYSIISTYAY